VASRALGLYAANTLGDGNCLFRALSDQLYGSPSYHVKLRQDICDWIESHKQRYEPFVEDERGLDVHLRCMRQQGVCAEHASFGNLFREETDRVSSIKPGTYGGHLELSAFAHLNRRDVKVMQPGLVYVIEWAAGWDPSDFTSPSSLPSLDGSQLDEREKRRLRREKRRSEQDKFISSNDASQQWPVYVAYVSFLISVLFHVTSVIHRYYDWEHFDSIRNLKGPHTGIPNVLERIDDSSQLASSPPRAKRKSDPKPSSKAQTLTKKPAVAAQKLAKVLSTSPPLFPLTPSQVPLPASRSPSPVGLSDPSSSDLPSVCVYPALPNLLDAREHRSPKRTFDESSASSQSEIAEFVYKKPRSSPLLLAHGASQEALDDVDNGVDAEMDVDGGDLDAETPGLSPSGFSTETSLSPLSSPSPTASPPPPEVRLTRRQRKALGLPKLRAHVVASRTTRASGKIVIPGGKFKKAVSSSAKQGIKVEPDDHAEWTKNGTGRVDVRGFRELKI
jgi:OTU domain-containing protein 3